MCLPFGGRDSKTAVGNCDEDMELEMATGSVSGGVTTHGSEFWWK